nr:hypothetical protein L203_01227 [Cryptococcus depauperatus CBS 7841]
MNHCRIKSVHIQTYKRYQEATIKPKNTDPSSDLVTFPIALPGNSYEGFIWRGRGDYTFGPIDSLRSRSLGTHFGSCDTSILDWSYLSMNSYPTEPKLSSYPNPATWSQRNFKLSQDNDTTADNTPKANPCKS